MTGELRSRSTSPKFENMETEDEGSHVASTSAVEFPLASGFLDVKLPARERRLALISWKAWRKRWVCVRRRAVSNNAYRIELQLASSHDTRDVTTLILNNASILCRTKSRSRPFAFALVVGGSPVLVMSAISETAAQNWMATIRGVLDSQKGISVNFDSLTSSVFAVSIIDNSDSRAAGLTGLYGHLNIGVSDVTVYCNAVPKLRWKLSHLARFYIAAVQQTEDKDKICVFQTSRKSSTGRGDFCFFCPKANELFIALTSAVDCQRRKQTFSRASSVDPDSRRSRSELRTPSLASRESSLGGLDPAALYEDATNEICTGNEGNYLGIEDGIQDSEDHTDGYVRQFLRENFGHLLLSRRRSSSAVELPTSVHFVKKPLKQQANESNDDGVIFFCTKGEGAVNHNLKRFTSEPDLLAGTKSTSVYSEDEFTGQTKSRPTSGSNYSWEDKVLLRRPSKRQQNSSAADVSGTSRGSDRPDSGIRVSTPRSSGGIQYNQRVSNDSGIKLGFHRNSPASVSSLYETPSYSNGANHDDNGDEYLLDDMEAGYFPSNRSPPSPNENTSDADEDELDCDIDNDVDNESVTPLPPPRRRKGMLNNRRSSQASIASGIYEEIPDHEVPSSTDTYEVIGDDDGDSLSQRRESIPPPLPPRRSVTSTGEEKDSLTPPRPMAIPKHKDLKRFLGFLSGDSSPRYDEPTAEFFVSDSRRSTPKEINFDNCESEDGVFGQSNEQEDTSGNTPIHTPMGSIVSLVVSPPESPPNVPPLPKGYRAPFRKTSEPPIFRPASTVPERKFSTVTPGKIYTDGDAWDSNSRGRKKDIQNYLGTTAEHNEGMWGSVDEVDSRARKTSLSSPCFSREGSPRASASDDTTSINAERSPKLFPKILSRPSQTLMKIIGREKSPEPTNGRPRPNTNGEGGSLASLLFASSTPAATKFYVGRETNCDDDDDSSSSSQNDRIFQRSATCSDFTVQGHSRRPPRKSDSFRNGRRNDNARQNSSSPEQTSNLLSPKSAADEWASEHRPRAVSTPSRNYNDQSLSCLRRSPGFRNRHRDDEKNLTPSPTFLPRSPRICSKHWLNLEKEGKVKERSLDNIVSVAKQELICEQHCFGNTGKQADDEDDSNIEYIDMGTVTNNITSHGSPHTSNPSERSRKLSVVGPPPVLSENIGDNNEDPLYLPMSQVLPSPVPSPRTSPAQTATRRTPPARADSHEDEYVDMSCFKKTPICEDNMYVIAERPENNNSFLKPAPCEKKDCDNDNQRKVSNNNNVIISFANLNKACEV